VVGGTSYWIQHLIFSDRLSVDPLSSPESGPLSSRPASRDLEEAMSLLQPDMLRLFHNLPGAPPSAATDPEVAFSLHTLLTTLDPPVAGRWHWRDTRKVLRSLVIIRNTGRLLSEIFVEQSRQSNVPRLEATRFGVSFFVTLLIDIRLCVSGFMLTHPC